MNSPGATESSGYTQRLVDNARRCDQERILKMLQSQAPGCCASSSSPKLNIPASSSIELKKQASCQIFGPSALTYPKAGVPEGIRIQHLIDSANRCGLPTQGTYRPLNRPSLPICVPPTAEQLNSTQPTAPMIGCQPSRFF